jgi:hypothetical protein
MKEFEPLIGESHGEGIADPDGNRVQMGQPG